MRTATRLLIAIACLMFPFPASGDAVLRGYAERGGCKVLSSVTGSSVKAQCSYPGATVTVYETGTLTLATLTSSSDCTTPKSNPFTANSVGYYDFCTAVGTYDLRFSGSGIAVPWTYTLVANDPAPQVLPVTDTTALVKGSSDATKKARIEVDTHVSTGQTRVIVMPNADTVLPIFAYPVTFNGVTAARTVTLPDGNTTVISASQPFVFTGTSASRTITWPDSATTIPTASQPFVFAGTTASRTITWPDASITVARTDAANTFTGNQTVTGNLLFSPDATYTIGAAGATRPLNIFASGSVYAATSFFGTILDSNAASDLVLKYNGSARLTFGASTVNTMVGHLRFSPDNTYDIGTGSLRPRDLVVANSITLGGLTMANNTGDARLSLLPSGGVSGLRMYLDFIGGFYAQLYVDGTNTRIEPIGKLIIGSRAGGSEATEIQVSGTSRFYFDNDGVTSDFYPSGTADIGVTTAFRNAVFSGSVQSPLFSPAAAANPTLTDGTDTTKRLAFDLTGITTGNTRVATPPNSNFTMARTDAAQTFTGLQTFASLAAADATNGGKATISQNSELITLSTVGTTSDSSANLLPADALILGVGCRITTTITTSANWSVGDTTTAARFSSANATLTAGTTSVGLNHWKGAVTTDATGPTQAAAAKLRITTNAAAGAGAVRCTVSYISFAAPTS